MNEPGAWCTSRTTTSQSPGWASIRGFKQIVEGKHDSIPEQAFYMKGTIEEVLEHAEQLKALS